VPRQKRRQLINPATDNSAFIDAISFIETTCVNPETDQPFILTEVERVFLSHAFEFTDDGRLVYPEQIFSAPKKTGKTALAALIVIYVVRVLGGRYAEGYCAANDFEQAAGRVFQAARRIIEASPLLRGDAIITANKIEFISTGATITALANDYAGAAGSNPTITVFDELWAFTSESAHRFFDESVPPPTRKLALRLTVTYAGFEGESDLLESLFKRGLRGEQIAPDLYAQPGMLMLWTNNFSAPWQNEEWREQMRQQLRPNAYLRLIENRWVSSESSFIEIERWDACITAAGPILADRALPVWLGIDASVTRDSTAIVVCTFNAQTKKARLVAHRIFQPSEQEPLDFEATIEAAVREMMQRYLVRECRYDPFQMVATAQRLTAAGVPMVEFAQTSSNLTEASTNLYEIIKGGNFIAYPDEEVRLAMQRSIAVETSRGWRIAKEKTSHKIDVIVALAQAAHGAVQGGAAPSITDAADFLIAGQPAPVPTRADAVFATMACDERGTAATAYWARTRQVGIPLLLIDVDLAPLSRNGFRAVREHLVALIKATNVGDSRGIYAPAAVAVQAEAAGLPAHAIDRQIMDRAALVISAAGHVADGSVKLAEAAFVKTRGLPLGSAARKDDPLANAILYGISIALDAERDSRAA
jgi:phage terminase large subunit-like protein